VTAAKNWVSAHKVTADFVARSKRKAVQAVHEVKVGQKWKARFPQSRNSQTVFAEIEIKEIRGKLIVAEDNEGKTRKLEVSKFRAVWDGWDLVSDVI
jgi:hypothetical protein